MTYIWLDALNSLDAAFRLEASQQVATLIEKMLFKHYFSRTMLYTHILAAKNIYGRQRC